MADSTPPPPPQEQFENLLGTISLHVNWRSITRYMTTEQRELFADAVDAWSRRLNADDPDELDRQPRWWRGDFVDTPDEREL